MNISFDEALTTCYKYVIDSQYSNIPTRKKFHLLDILKNSVSEKSHFKLPCGMIWKITSQCNLRCRHCFYHSKPDFLNSKNDFSKDEIMAFARFLAEELNIVTIKITGGEPFLLGDTLFELIEYLLSKNIYITIQTNATLLDNECVKKLRKFTKRKTIRFEVSLDGLSADTHDYIRGKNNFNKTITGIKKLIQLGFSVQCNLTSMKSNLQELPRLYDFCIEMGIKRFGFNKFKSDSADTNYLVPALEDEIIAIAQLIKNIKSDDVSIDFKNIAFPQFLDYEKGLELADKTLEYIEKFGVITENICTRGCHNHDTFALLSDGRVTLCPALDEEQFVLGNIREQSFYDIWDTRFDNIMFQERCPQNFICGKCKYLKLCSCGCTAASFSKYGTINAPSVYCKYVNKLIGE